jgi:phage gp36-like protein
MPSSYSVDQVAIVNRLSNDRVIQLTDDAGAGSIDAAKVTEAIDAAEAEFHLYAGVYYDTPVRKSDNTIPQGIREKLIEATAWRLMNRRPEFLRGEQDEGKLWQKIRDSVETWYEAIAHPDKGKRLLIPGAKDKSTPLVPRAGSAKLTADTPRFTEDRMKGFF